MKKLGRNEPCPCGSGLKYKQCCWSKRFQWMRDDENRLVRCIPSDSGGREFLVVPQDCTDKHPNLSNSKTGELDKSDAMVEIMEQAGIDPAIIYAFRKTGYLVTHENQDLIPEVGLSEWRAAIHEYKAVHEKTEKLNGSELSAEHSAANHVSPGPDAKDTHLSMGFPTKIPVPVPWNSAEWAKKSVGELSNDDRFVNFIADWSAELQRRPESPQYLRFALAHCGHTPDTKATPEVLASLLWKTVELCSKKPVVVDHPVAAFELVSSVAGFADYLAEKWSKRQKAAIKDPYTGVRGSLCIFACMAVTRHFAEQGSAPESEAGTTPVAPSVPTVA